MNGHETEAKFYAQDLNRIGMRLRQLKARLIQARVHETNIRFDAPDGSLRRASKVLRLRKDTDAKFTFKGPSEEHEGVMRRREIEFTIGDFAAATQFLEALGFEPIVFYEKFRETYEINGVHVMLDELPYGNFVEIEGENVKALRETAGLLGLKWEAMVRAGYHALFERITGKYNLDPAQLSFKALETVRVTQDDLNVIPADQ